MGFELAHASIPLNSGAGTAGIISIISFPSSLSHTQFLFFFLPVIKIFSLVFSQNNPDISDRNRILDIMYNIFKY
jgi:hypothetical protein